MDDKLCLDPIQRSAQEQFGKQSHRYGQGHILEDVSDVHSALGLLALPQPADVLDVATGAGHTGLLLATLGHRVTLADIAEPMLKRAAAAAASRGLHVEVQQHPAEKLPYPDARFDLVTCRVAAHHFSSPELFVRETARVLRPSGYFLLIDNSVEDGQPEAEAWLHGVEKHRDPSHHRCLAPGAWRALCEPNKLIVLHSILTPFKQPDLNWYFDTAATSPSDRERVLELVAHAPEAARRVFGLSCEEGKIVWWWQRLTLIARKHAQDTF